MRTHETVIMLHIQLALTFERIGEHEAAVSELNKARFLLDALLEDKEDRRIVARTEKQDPRRPGEFRVGDIVLPLLVPAETSHVPVGTLCTVLEVDSKEGRLYLRPHNGTRDFRMSMGAVMIAHDPFGTPQDHAPSERSSISAVRG